MIVASMRPVTDSPIEARPSFLACCGSDTAVLLATTAHTHTHTHTHSRIVNRRRVYQHYKLLSNATTPSVIAVQRFVSSKRTKDNNNKKKKKLCAWRHNMPPPLSSPPWAPKRLARRRAEAT